MRIVAFPLSFLLYSLLLLLFFFELNQNLIDLQPVADLDQH